MYDSRPQRRPADYTDTQCGMENTYLSRQDHTFPHSGNVEARNGSAFSLARELLSTLTVKRATPSIALLVVVAACGTDPSLVCGEGGECYETVTDPSPTIMVAPPPSTFEPPVVDPTLDTPCGNGVLDGSEQCDDGNLVAGDGCDSTCGIQSGWACVGTPSDCELMGPPPPPPAFDMLGATYCVAEVDVSNTTFSGNTVTGLPNSGGGGLSLDMGFGPTAADDRLLVGFNISSSNDMGTHLFELKGARDEGDFGYFSTLTYLYGRNVDSSVGGRPASTAYLSSESANAAGNSSLDLAVLTFTGDDAIRLYDRNMMSLSTGAHINDAYATLPLPGNYNGGAIDEAPMSGKLLFAAHNSQEGTPILRTVDLNSMTFDNNTFDLTTVGLPSDARIGDLSQLENGNYLATIVSDTAPSIVELAISGNSNELSVTVVNEMSLSSHPALERFGSISGAAVGRPVNGAEVVYLTSVTATNTVSLLTLTATTSGSCPTLQ